jgi:hypothetical protein
VEHNGYWLIVLQVQSVDIENKSEAGQKATLSVFQNVMKSFPSDSQVIFRKTPLDFCNVINDLEYNIQFSPNQQVTEYALSYIDYVKEVSRKKLDKVNYLIIKTQRRMEYEEGKQYLEGVYHSINRALSGLNISVTQVTGKELHDLYKLPDFIKEEVDYFVYGEEVRRTYVVKDYPREAYPNWLKPLFDYQYPVELSQHFHPIPRSTVIRQLEVMLAKLQSTMDLQQQNGDVVSSELKVRKDDTEDLLRRLASGEDMIMETSFYITISAPDTEILKYRSVEMESYMRSCGLDFRTCRKQVKKGIRCSLPIACDHLLESYTFDTKSLSTILPFTVQDYTGKSGILYGMSSDMTELITLDLWSMPNPNKIILGKSGFGKSMLAKTETARHIINGVQAIILDHDGEWSEFCNILGGDYIDNADANINWNHHLLVFSGKIKEESLRTIWYKIKSEGVKQRVLVIEEFHNILRKDKELLLQVAKEIRKSGTAPTFITQNVKEFIMSEEGQMIFDNCSIKVLMRQGENDLQEIEKLFHLSNSESNYLQTCPIGYGYLYTDLYKTRFKVDYSEREEEILSTNPLHKLRRVTK